MDDFAKRKKMKSAHLDEQLVEAGTAISDAMSTVSTLIASAANKDKKKDGYICNRRRIETCPRKK